MHRRAVSLSAALALCAVLGACRAHDVSDVPEWTPADHSRAPGESPNADLPPPSAPEDQDPLAVARVLFTAQCTPCHGPGGHGDGPQAAMFHPPDFTTQAFQSMYTDQALRDSIVHGHGAMPAFGEAIRPEGVDALVRYVRQLGSAAP